MSILRPALAAVLALWACQGKAEQRPDLTFHYHNPAVAFAPGTGPVVGIDAGHHNFHTAEGRFAPFAKLVAEDGFQVRSLHGPFDKADLAGVKILVIANALDAFNVNNYVLPTPSAFSDQEIGFVQGWVKAGGSLLLIADHMPWAGAAADLGKAFGFGFVNGYAFALPSRSTRFTFTKDHGLILDDLGVGLPPTRKFVTTTGQAFTFPKEAVPLLLLNGLYIARLPRVAGDLQGAPAIDISNYAQGAIRDFGAGRVAVFGEASAFTAQVLDDGNKMGMNAPDAGDNPGFVLKVVRWLARYVPPG